MLSSRKLCIVKWKTDVFVVSVIVDIDVINFFIYINRDCNILAVISCTYIVDIN